MILILDIEKKIVIDFFAVHHEDNKNGESNSVHVFFRQKSGLHDKLLDIDTYLHILFRFKTFTRL